VSRAPALFALAASALVAQVADAGMPRREPPLLLGGARPKVRREIPLDPRLPTGAEVNPGTRPASGPPRCSWLRPVCVHGGDDASATEAALRALEDAYDRLVLTLELPAPRADRGLGGSDALDAYLVPASAALEVRTDGVFTGPFTVSSAFCHLPALADPELLARNATLCLGEAIAFGLDASEPPHLRRAFATHLWWTVGLPSAVDVEAVDRLQAHPEEPIATRDLAANSEGAALFFQYLEDVRSAGAPGQLAASLFAASVSDASAAGLDYLNSPDLFDVLRHSLEEEPDRFAALMVDFAVARAFVGDRDDGLHLVDMGWPGAFGRVRFDWKIDFSSLPRRVSVSPPVDSSGAVLLFVDLDEVGIGATLGMRVEWEPPVNFQWQLVKLAADGQELGRVDVPFQTRARSAEARLSSFDGARAVLIVGTNLEGIDLAHPFDPDVAPFEPHGVTVYLARM
jgi:hypothetical protein